MIDNKEVKRVLIAGQQRTGKSTLARQLAAKIPLFDHLVIEPDPLGDAWKQYGYNLIEPTPETLRAPGKKRIVFDMENNDFLDMIFKNVFNHVLIFDDSLFLLTNIKRYKQLSMILGRARQTGNYIFFTIHSVSSVPAPFWDFFTDVILFKTRDKIKRGNYKIPNFELLEAAQTEVKRNANLRAFVYIKM